MMGGIHMQLHISAAGGSSDAMMDLSFCATREEMHRTWALWGDTTHYTGLARGLAYQKHPFRMQPSGFGFSMG